MDSAAMLRSFYHCVGTGSHKQSLVESQAIWSPSSTLRIPGSRVAGKLLCSISCVKEASQNVVVEKVDGESNCPVTDCRSFIWQVNITAIYVVSAKRAEDSPKGTPVVKALQNATFPTGFEALISEICDETEVAEVKLRVGDFEMHLKRNVGVTKAPRAIISPTVAPPIPSEPMIESLPAALPPSPPKAPAEKSSFFKNASQEKSPKLQALEASGSAGFVLVTSPTVGSFRRARTFKGKKQPPSCKEGDMIKEGQTIGFLDQFGTELPVKSDVAGEVLKLLVTDGEPVGYGDPLIAVLPSFHGIKI